MDPKYLGKIVNLPKDITGSLEKLRAHLTRVWGFAPSYSETVAFALKQATPIPEPLTDGDYVLDGDTIWIDVGKRKAVRITRTKGDVRVDIFDNKEVAASHGSAVPIDSAEAKL